MKNAATIRSSDRLRTLLLGTSLLCIAAPHAALAQTTPTSTTTETLAAETAPVNRTGEEEIIVTGSRLIRHDLAAPSPTTVVGEADIKLSGNVTLEKTLNQFPQLGQGNTTSVNNGGGSGILAANLRGLGSTRTLTLVNGRRFVAANSGGDVDLASIPDTLIQRVDIITGGASAVYGSDAIAGAVNFVLKDNFHGFETGAQYGITDRGDGSTQKYDLTMGANLGDDNRGNVTLAMSYTKQKPFTQGDRDFAQIPLADNAAHTAFVYSGSGNIPGTRIPLSATNLARVVGVTPATGACTTVTSVRFLPGGIPAQYCSPENSYNYAAFNLLQRPLSRINVSALAHYDLGEHITAFSEVYFVDTKNNSILAPDSFSPVTPSATNPLTTILLVPYRNNPALPAVTSNFFAANTAIFDPTNSGTASISSAGLRTEDLGTRRSFYERQAYDITGGFRGAFDMFGNEFRWEVFGQTTRNREDTRNFGTVNQARLSLALDAITSGGQVVCRSPVNGCVPVNIFGTGGISQAAAAFLTPERDALAIFNRRVGGASISGDLFSLPAGPVAAAVGVEYRKDKFSSTPSPFDRAGDYGAASTRSLSGAFDVKEAFGEIRVPLLNDITLVKSLSLEGAVRFSDYSSVGHTTAYKGGAEYAPISWVRLRGAYNRAVRAPNVAELFNTIAQGYTGGTDPCDKSQTRTAARLAFCVSQGIGAADIANFTQSGLGLTQQSGGNPNLSPEKTDTYTIGGVVSPPFVRGLNLTADYFKVNVKDAIITPNVSQVLNDCFATLSSSNPSCQAIVRGPSGQINYISTQTLNIGYLKVSGLDTQLDYKLNLPDAVSIGGEPATLSLAAVASWLFHKTQKTLTNTIAQDCAGYYGSGCSSGTGGFILPDFKLNMNASYSSGAASLRVQARMIGALDVFPGTAAFVTHVSPVWYVDTTIGYNIGEHLRLFAGVNNLADKKPPVLGTTFVGDANVDVSLYDVAGRRYFGGATVKF